eukprot:Gb_20789 [translate_table: standard]
MSKSKFLQQCRDLKRTLAAVQMERDDALAQVAVLRRAFSATAWQHRQRKTSQIVHSERPEMYPCNLEEMHNVDPISEPSKKFINSNMIHIEPKDGLRNFEKSKRWQYHRKHGDQGKTCTSCPNTEVKQSGFSKIRQGNAVEGQAIILDKDITDASREEKLEMATLISLSGEESVPTVPSKGSVQSSKEKCESWLKTRDEYYQVQLGKVRLNGKLWNKRSHKYLTNHSTVLTHNFRTENMRLVPIEEPSTSDDLDHDEICAEIDKWLNAEALKIHFDSILCVEASCIIHESMLDELHEFDRDEYYEICSGCAGIVSTRLRVQSILEQCFIASKCVLFCWMPSR